MNPIVLLDSLYVIFSLATALLLLWYHKRIKFYILNFFPIFGLTLMGFLYGIALFIEWDGISLSFEHYENLIGAMLPMFWIFVFYALFQHQSIADVSLSEERMQFVIKGTQAGLWDWWIIENRLTVNDRWAELLGYTLSELQPVSFQTWLNQQHPEDIELSNRAIEEHFNNITDHYECDVRMKHKNGNWVWIYSRGSVVQRNEQGQPLRMTGIHIDITEKKQILLELENHRLNLEILVQERTDDLECVNEELRAINEEIHQKNEQINLQNNELQATLKNLQNTQMQLIQAEKMASLGILTAGVAHEINNPLNFIRGGYIGLERYFNHTESFDQENINVLLESINVGIERACSIVNSLNQFSRNKESFDEKCDIHTIIDNCLTMLLHETKHLITINKQYTSTPFAVQGNAGKLHQVFINILHNAIQSICNEGQITITTQKQAQGIKIQITDTGCGIKPENISHITDPFYTTKEPGLGTGLGLSISYSIIQSHQGSLAFQSQINQGTTATIILPTID